MLGTEVPHSSLRLINCHWRWNQPCHGVEFGGWRHAVGRKTFPELPDGMRPQFGRQNSVVRHVAAFFRIARLELEAGASPAKTGTAATSKDAASAKIFPSDLRQPPQFPDATQNRPDIDRRAGFCRSGHLLFDVILASHSQVAAAMRRASPQRQRRQPRQPKTSPKA